MIEVKYKRNPKVKGNRYKKEIPLLTLLANESTKGSRELLKKHGKQDAINHIDLENRLANLYETSDSDKKILLDKELAEIHPHKDFIINALDLVPKSELLKIREEINQNPQELKLNLEGDKTEKKDKVLMLSIVSVVALTIFTIVMIKK